VFPRQAARAASIARVDPLARMVQARVVQGDRLTTVPAWVLRVDRLIRDSSDQLPGSIIQRTE